MGGKILRKSLCVPAENLGHVKKKSSFSLYIVESINCPTDKINRPSVAGAVLQTPLYLIN